MSLRWRTPLTPVVVVKHETTETWVQPSWVPRSDTDQRTNSTSVTSTLEVQLMHVPFFLHRRSHGKNDPCSSFEIEKDRQRKDEEYTSTDIMRSATKQSKEEDPRRAKEGQRCPASTRSLRVSSFRSLRSSWRLLRFVSSDPRVTALLLTTTTPSTSNL
jgi:hypothetical protein